MEDVTPRCLEKDEVAVFCPELEFRTPLDPDLNAGDFEASERLPTGVYVAY